MRTQIPLSSRAKRSAAEGSDALADSSIRSRSLGMTVRLEGV